MALSEYLVWRQIAEHEPITPTQLRNRLGLSKCQIHKYIKDLRDQGKIVCCGSGPHGAFLWKCAEYPSRRRIFGKEVKKGDFVALRGDSLTCETMTVTNYGKPESVMVPYDTFAELVDCKHELERLKKCLNQGK